MRKLKYTTVYESMTSPQELLKKETSRSACDVSFPLTNYNQHLRSTSRLARRFDREVCPYSLCRKIAKKQKVEEESSKLRKVPS